VFFDTFCVSFSFVFKFLVFEAAIYANTDVYINIGHESVPIQLAQCRFPGLVISSAKISIYFSNKIYGSNFIKQHSGL